MLAFIFLSISSLLLLALVKALHKLWWVPTRVQHMMRAQGINGPSYQFLYGNVKEFLAMKAKTDTKPMDFIDHNVFPKIMPHTYTWMKTYGKNYLWFLGPTPQLVVTDPDMAKEILANKHGVYTKVKPQGHIKKLLGDGLVVAEGEKWMKLRKIANHTFLIENVKDLMFPAMLASVEKLLERWTTYESEEIEVYQEYKELTCEVISRTAFGSSYLEGKRVFDGLTNLAVIIKRTYTKMRFPLLGIFVKSGDDIEAEKEERDIHDSIMRMIRKREEKVSRGEAQNYGKDLLGALIKAYRTDDESSKITIQAVIDECRLFYVAGQETTTGLLSWTTLLLATHRDWQEKAREEVLEVFGKSKPNPEGIGKLKTMSLILSEALRLYSPVVELTRNVDRGVKLGKLTIPANIQVSVPIKAMHHDPELWGKDVHLFKPERFAEGMVKATNNVSAAYAPFGFGHRICVGMNFAHIEIKIALSMILQRYDFTISPNYVHAPNQFLTVCPQHGIQVIFKKLRE